MKKHENAIKAILKKGDMLHGYYEDKAGARYIVNGHIIIKLSGSKLDFIGELPKLNKCGWTDTLNRCIDEAKKGKFEIDINMNDVKMWDKYGDKIAPYQFIVDKKYMGLSAFYLNKLYTLTDNNIITTTNFKSPVYIAGDDIECVLMPVTLVKGYDENNYNKFITELKACYIQDEADKAARKEKREAKKNAETMTEIKEGETINGFYAYLSGCEYFLKTDNKRITKKVVEHFIKAVGIVKGKNADTIEKMTTLKENVDYTKERISNATLKKNTIGNYTFIDIDGDNFSYGGNIDELKGKLYIFDFDALTPITFYQDEEKTTAADVMSATDTDTANNDNITATQDIKTTETMQADARQTETTQDTPHKTSKKAVSLFVVTDKPQPVKLSGHELPTLKQLERIPTYTQRIISRFKPLKSHRVYNNRVNNKKSLKKAYNDFVGTVSCYNDKYAISGGSVAVNSS